jgi:hypothetical protein
MFTLEACRPNCVFSAGDPPPGLSCGGCCFCTGVGVMDVFAI